MDYKDEKYILKVLGYHYDPSTGPLHKEFRLKRSFPTLKDAFKGLQQFDDRMFIERLVKKNNWEFGIDMAAIVTSSAKVLVTKREMLGFAEIGIPEALYLHIKIANISPQEFGRQAGTDLNTYEQLSEKWGYFLVDSFDQMMRKAQQHSGKIITRKYFSGSKWELTAGTKPKRSL